MTDWKTRWEQGMTGWHNQNVNQNLQNHANILFENTESPRVLIPLCGKSLDIIWLEAQSASVIGIEFVQKAIEEFYQEQDSTPHIEVINKLPHHSVGGITLICADIFEATPARIGQFDAIYDRAALVALPLEKRQEYADHCLALLNSGGTILLITYNTHRSETLGPPFPIKDGVIPTLYKNASECILLEESTQTKEDNPRLAKRNLEWSKTAIWKIVK
jgi:thiopurine S-methyltransferase